MLIVFTAEQMAPPGRRIARFADGRVHGDDLRVEGHVFGGVGWGAAHAARVHAAAGLAPAGDPLEVDGAVLFVQAQVDG